MQAFNDYTLTLAPTEKCPQYKAIGGNGIIRQAGLSNCYYHCFQPAFGECFHWLRNFPMLGDTVKVIGVIGNGNVG